MGSGGHKPSEAKEFQEVNKLTEENYFLREVSKELTSRIKDRRIEYVNNPILDLRGELCFPD